MILLISKYYFGIKYTLIIININRFRILYKCLLRRETRSRLPTKILFSIENALLEETNGPK